jgi:hypothetical protein
MQNESSMLPMPKNGCLPVPKHYVRLRYYGFRKCGMKRMLLAGRKPGAARGTLARPF